MKKLIIALALALIAPAVFAQTDVDRHEIRRHEKTGNVQIREENQVRPEVRPEGQRESRTTETHSTVTFRGHDRGFFREHGPRFWRSREGHDRNWYIVTFGEPNLREIGGCWYYRYGDCYWPAFGYGPTCLWPNGDGPICD